MSPMKSRVSALRRVDPEPDWTGWEIRDSSSGDPLEHQLGKPGLWHYARAGATGTGPGVKRFLYPEFDHLAWLVGGEARDLDRVSLKTELRDWAHATSRGELPPDWSSPDQEQAASWLNPGRLTVRSGPHLAMGQLACDDQGLRVIFPELVQLSDELSSTRLAWIRELCLDTQSRWHMVRFGLLDRRVRAEVDLSGVPEGLARPLFALGFEALVFSVRWALPSFAFVSDPGAASAVLDRGPWWLKEKAIPSSTRETRDVARLPECAG